MANRLSFEMLCAVMPDRSNGYSSSVQRFAHFTGGVHMSLQARVALISGAGRGAEAGIAVALAEDGANVVRFLMSERNSNLRVERVYCDGGGPPTT